MSRPPRIVLARWKAFSQLLIPVGEFWKTRHPRNVEVNEICDASFQGAKNTRRSRVWNSRSLEVTNARWTGLPNSRSLGVANARWLGVSNLLSPEFVNSWRLKAMNLQNHELRESAKFGNMMEDKFGSHGAWSTNYQEAKSKLSSQKVRV
jgi:hypothetical protein